jgi:hypothetical protein
LPRLNQIAAFNLFNEARSRGAYFVAAGNHPPMILNVRDDLRTRLGWGLIYQLHELTDEDKIDALERAAAARGMQVICRRDSLPDHALPARHEQPDRDAGSARSLLAGDQTTDYAAIIA